jgi:hypothetical protein
MHKIIACVVALYGLACSFSGNAWSQTPCTLANSQVSLDVVGILGGSATSTVQAGSVEFNPAPGDGRFSVDVENSTIRMFNNTASTNVLFNNATTYTVNLGASSPVFITAISVAVNGVTGFLATNVSFTARSVTFTVTGSTWHGGDNVTVTLETACPPCTAIGKQAAITVVGVLGGNATTTVQAGPVEFNPAPGDGRFSVDVENSTIRMFNNTASTNVLFNNATTYTVNFGAGSALSIAGVSVAVNGVSGFVPANVSFTPQSVTFTVTGSTWHGGDNVMVTLQTVCTPCTLDVDGNNVVDALTDGLMILRAMFGLTGASVTNGAVGGGATRPDWATIRPYLNNICAATFAP